MDDARARQLLRAFDFQTLFVEQLGWNRVRRAPLPLDVDGQPYTLRAIAEKAGMVAWRCEPTSDGTIPEAPIRRKIERQVRKQVHEHTILYVDEAQQNLVWQWIKRAPGQPDASREHHFYIGQSGDALLQKLRPIAFELSDEDSLTIGVVTGRFQQGFDKDKVTRRFYGRFETEHKAFRTFIKGIPGEKDLDWYTSVMLNRLMFVYFIQWKGFLDGDDHYLHNRLRRMQEQQGRDNFYSFYRHFLLRLFHEGLAQQPQERAGDLDALFGDVPYLNGGIFEPHRLEREHDDIQIPDEAFERLFAFFDAYVWHLDERLLKNDREINPDVLGYIFEKYINQKEMGAYYTKEDITEYIGKNTIIPFLFDAAHGEAAIAFTPDAYTWRLLQDDPDRYIYDAVRHGVDLTLPTEIALGLDDVSNRDGWNRPAAEGYALPTETWREHIDRRQLCKETRGKIVDGQITSIDDLITYNLNIRRFAQDVIERSEGPELVRAFYRAITRVSILDLTCGSGAFLFAGLNILEPLYDACLDRMEAFIDDLERSGEHAHPQKFSDFRAILAEAERHPNRRYFVLKSIVINNLYGVDIMAEAVEICKLRLFLKLVAQVEHKSQIEPLPDIDFNIRAGNTLVGFTSLEQVREALTLDPIRQMRRLPLLEDLDALAKIEARAKIADSAFQSFRTQQTQYGGHVSVVDKESLRRSLGELADDLDRLLARLYGISPEDEPSPLLYEARFIAWRASHQPFHWFAEFYGIMIRGGFALIIGNPPYVEYSKIKREYTVHDYRMEICGNLYAMMVERGMALLTVSGRLGFIVPVAAVCTEGYAPLQDLLRDSGSTHISAYNDRPGKLFEGLEHIRLVIMLHERNVTNRAIFTTRYNKWHSDSRAILFDNLGYSNSASSLVRGSIPKIHNTIERDIIRKLSTNRMNIDHYTSKFGEYTINYTRKLSGFVQILDFVPIILDDNGNERDPSELKTLNFNNPNQRDAFLSILNSNLFFWFLTIHSDCRNLNKREISSMPFDADLASTDIIEDLRLRSSELMSDLQSHTKMLEMRYQTLGTLTIQCIYPKLSKPIIDKIDRVLARHYGFTDKELDFIINYDIKYRMGREGAEDDD